MVPILILSLITGVPDDFELPPDIVMFARSGGQVFIGVWESVDVPEEEGEMSADLPGMLQDKITGGDGEIRSLSSCPPGADGDDGRGAPLFHPAAGTGAEACEFPRLWTSESPADSSGRALYFWTDDPLMDKFLRQYSEGTVYLEIEEVEDPGSVPGDGFVTLRVVEVRTGGTTFEEWKEFTGPPVTP